MWFGFGWIRLGVGVGAGVCVWVDACSVRVGRGELMGSDFGKYSKTGPKTLTKSDLSQPG